MLRGMRDVDERDTFKSLGTVGAVLVRELREHQFDKPDRESGHQKQPARKGEGRDVDESSVEPMTHLALLRERQGQCEADQNAEANEAGADQETANKRRGFIVLIVIESVVSRRPFGRRVADNITHVHAPVVDLREF